MILALEKMNWRRIIHSTLIFVLAFYLNLYLINMQIMDDIPKIAEPFKEFISFSKFTAFISLIGIILYIIVSINQKFLKKILLAYITFIFARYFIVITRNLNNKSFEISNFLKNNIFQVEVLYILLLFLIPSIILYFILKRYDQYDRLFNLFENFNAENVLIGIIFSIAFFKTNESLVFYIDRIPDLTSGNSFLKYLKVISEVNISISILITLITYTLLKSFKHIKKLKPSLQLSFTSSLFFAIIFNYTLQYGVRTDTDLLGLYIFPGATSFQIFVLLLLFLLVYVATNRYLASTLLIATLGIIISIANIIKEKMRSEPLLPIDFLWVKDLKLVLSFVDNSIIIYLFFALIIPVLLYFLIKHFVDVTPIFNKKSYRFICFLTLSCLFITGFYIFKNEEDGKIAENIPLVSKVNNFIDVEWMGFDVNARYKSVMYVWTKQLTKRIMKEPKTYDEHQMKAIAKKYKDLSVMINKERSQSINNQTVIFILSESLSNPNRIDGVSTSTPLLPNIESIKNTTTSGIMHSDGYGGGTANMEFEAITGLPYYNFSPSVSTLYTEVVPKLKYFPSLSHFYHKKDRYVLHPSNSNNYNRKQVYEKLGFDHLIFSDSTKEKFTYDSNIGVNMSDDSLYNNIINKIDSSSNQFFSIITMQNHAPWSVGSPEDVIATGENFSESENNNFTEYARLLTYTDDSTKKFLDNLNRKDKEITVVFYGDHLPGLYPDSIFKNSPDVQYQTDYFIWSNHNKNQLNHPLVNSSDFPALLLKHTHSKVTPYYALLTKVLENATVDKENLTDEQEKILDDLRLVQFDMTLGKNYLENLNFYKIGE